MSREEKRSVGTCCCHWGFCKAPSTKQNEIPFLPQGNYRWQELHCIRAKKKNNHFVSQTKSSALYLEKLLKVRETG